MLKNNNCDSILFSVVIATCNRPDLANRAIRSVLEQSFDRFEVIVVNNGSSPDSVKTYASNLSDIIQDIVYIDLNNAFSVGLGPSVSRNYGISKARGKYITFCDDDDEWVDPEYLSRIADFLSVDQAQIIVSNQEAETASGELTESWFDRDKLILSGETLSKKLFYSLSLEQFYNNGGFPHLNTTIYLKKLIDDFGGFCINLTYEEDFELFFRLSSYANSIVYFDKVIGKHYIPNKNKEDNLTTKMQYQYKLLSRVFIFNKLLIENRSKDLTRYAKQHGSYTVRRISEEALLARDFRLAHSMALQSIGWYPSLSTIVFFLKIKCKILFLKISGAYN